AVQAREQALLQGQVEAYGKLISRVVPEADRARLPDVSPDAVESLVSDFSVSDEKSSATRYIATLSVHFDSERVSAFLKANGVAMVQGTDETVVLLGVYRAAPDLPPHLWEEDNPWRTVLAQTAVSRGLFPVAVPLGDLLDMTQVPVDKALALDAEAMDALLARYGADAVIVADAEARPGMGVHLAMKRYPRPLPAGVSALESPIADDPAAALGDLAAHAVLAVARGAKPAVMETIVGEFDSLAILVSVDSIADWVRVDQTLRALPGVRAVLLRASRTDVVQAAVQYSGDSEALHQAMSRVGFSVDVRDGYWEVLPHPEPATPVIQ
ncbi:MAG: DUF2066 domain-containing protein, partial [Rhodospirillaceae bacterium]|nr:DUF2066 domain-containing protein [Rhodospirillaceae bacterium]